MRVEHDLHPMRSGRWAAKQRSVSKGKVCVLCLFSPQHDRACCGSLRVATTASWRDTEEQSGLTVNTRPSVLRPRFSPDTRIRACCQKAMRRRGFILYLNGAARRDHFRKDRAIGKARAGHVPESMVGLARTRSGRPDATEAEESPGKMRIANARI